MLLPYRLSMILAAAAIGLTLALCGCGSSSADSQGAAGTAAARGTTAVTASSQEKAPPDNLSLSSSALLSPISSRHTCDGANVSLPFRWGAIPHGTAELGLFVASLQPVHEKLFTNWAVAGLKPSLRSLPAGRLPSGAIVGRNGVGRNSYSVCPPRGAKESYVVRLFALPRKLHLSPGFDAEAAFKKMLNSASSSALLTFSYRRR